MTLKEQLRLLDEIGFLGTQENLSPATRKLLDKQIEEGIRAYEESLKKRKTKKARRK